jgi:ABC-type proline/glycine betaine transport system, ATPase component
VQVGKPEEIIMNPADDYVAAFVKDVNRAKVLRAKTIMLSLEQNHFNENKFTETIKVNENSFVEEFLPTVLEKHPLVEVIDKQGNTIGFITEKEIAKSLSKSKLESL